MKDEIQWFGEKGKDGIKVVKTAGKAIGACVGLAVVGVALGVVGNVFGGSK
jgi:predicted ATP-dependent protease